MKATNKICTQVQMCPKKSIYVKHTHRSKHKPLGDLTGGHVCAMQSHRGFICSLMPYLRCDMWNRTESSEVQRQQEQQGFLMPATPLKTLQKQKETFISVFMSFSGDVSLFNSITQRQPDKMQVPSYNISHLKVQTHYGNYRHCELHYMLFKTSPVDASLK